MENSYYYTETLKDIYMLLERCRIFAKDMHDKLPTKYGYIMECCGCIDFMCECTQRKLCNLTGGLKAYDLIQDFSLVDWSHEWKQKQEGKKKFITPKDGATRSLHLGVSARKKQ